MLRSIVAWSALALGLAFAAHFITPWPSVLVIRAVFDKGAADASAALEKHVPADVTAREAIRYDPGDPDALFDIYRAARPRPGAPTIVWVHGGGFVSGRRGDIANYLKVLAGQGFTTVNIDYTIAPGATYPTPVRQVTRALAFLDRHAEELGINRESLVIAGDSAGAQIAAQVANLVTSPAYAAQVGIASPIRAEQLDGTLLYCGVYDMEALGRSGSGALGWFLRTVAWAYGGERDWREVEAFEQMSVARHMTPAFPATFISAGNDDPLEPQSRIMDDALRARGVRVESLFYPDGHEPALSHEYQFDLDGADGRHALARSVAWLSSLPGQPAR